MAIPVSKKHTIDIAEDDPAHQSARKTLKVLHVFKDGKENITAASNAMRSVDLETKKKQLATTAVGAQTEPFVSYRVTEEELTKEIAEPGYWLRRAKECQTRYEQSQLENEVLRGRVEYYKDLYEMSQKLLEESRDMVDVLRELLENIDEDEAQTATASNPTEQDDWSPANEEQPDQH